MSNFVAIDPPLLRYGDFSIFQNGGRHHLGFYNFEISSVGTVSKVKLRHRAKISWRSVKPLMRYGDFSIFPRWRPFAIWICDARLNHPRRAFDGLYT